MKRPNPPFNGLKTMKVTSQTGTITNGNFRLVAKHLLLEVDSENFELLTGFAEGGVEIHLLEPGAEIEYIAYASGAIYHPSEARIILRDWTGSKYNGVFEPAGMRRDNVSIPTDGSFFGINYTQTTSEQPTYSDRKPLMSAA